MSRFAYPVLCCIVSLSLLMFATEALGVGFSGQDGDSGQNSVGDVEGVAAAKLDGQWDSDVVETTAPPTVLPIAPAPQSAPRTILSNRLLLTGTLVVVLLGQLSVLFGYLKIDHATRGFYSGRLQSFAAFAAVAVFVIGYLFYMSWKA